MGKLKRFFKRVKNEIIKDRLYCYRGQKKVDLLIYDDIFPHPISGFRFEEFTYLLKEFKNSKIVMDNLSYNHLNSTKALHKVHIQQLIDKNSWVKRKCELKRGLININTELFYCVFFLNIIRNLDWLEKFKIPFIFTLYPGGGFQVNNPKIDNKLKKIFSSSYFQKVIVTQSFTKDYLINNQLCDPNKICFIYGCVVPQKSITIPLKNKVYYSPQKPTFDVCFCAAKYTPLGEDKGYGVFIDYAKKLAAEFDFVRFHIIGGFTEKDIDVTSILDKTTFYGYQNFEDLATIYQGMDIIVSPNKPFILRQGAFDGFPLGTVVEAVLNGVVALASDNLNQNIFVDGEELIIINHDSEDIFKKTVALIKNPDLLKQIAENGRRAFLKVYSNDNQMDKRIELLKSVIDKN